MQRLFVVLECAARRSDAVAVLTKLGADVVEPGYSFVVIANATDLRAELKAVLPPELVNRSAILIRPWDEDARPPKLSDQYVPAPDDILGDPTLFVTSRVVSEWFARTAKTEIAREITRDALAAAVVPRQTPRPIKSAVQVSFRYAMERIVADLRRSENRLVLRASPSKTTDTTAAVFLGIDQDSVHELASSGFGFRTERDGVWHADLASEVCLGPGDLPATAIPPGVAAGPTYVRFLRACGGGDPPWRVAVCATTPPPPVPRSTGPHSGVVWKKVPADRQFEVRVEGRWPEILLPLTVQNLTEEFKRRLGSAYKEFKNEAGRTSGPAGGDDGPPPEPDELPPPESPGVPVPQRERFAKRPDLPDVWEDYVPWESRLELRCYLIGVEAAAEGHGLGAILGAEGLTIALYDQYAGARFLDRIRKQLGVVLGQINRRGENRPSIDSTLPACRCMLCRWYAYAQAEAAQTGQTKDTTAGLAQIRADLSRVSAYVVDFAAMRLAVCAVSDPVGAGAPAADFHAAAGRAMPALVRWLYRDGRAFARLCERVDRMRVGTPPYFDPLHGELYGRSLRAENSGFVRIWSVARRLAAGVENAELLDEDQVKRLLEALAAIGPKSPVEDVVRALRPVAELAPALAAACRRVRDDGILVHLPALAPVWRERNTGIGQQPLSRIAEALRA